MLGHNLDRGDGHVIYWEVEEEGERKVPVLVLHGGWGPLAHDGQFLDPARFRRVTLHQRGWGRSTPLGGLTNNTVAAILEDVEAVRKELGINQWIVTGGSTGAMLALAYGADHPTHCLGVVLRGLWCLGQEELGFNYEDQQGKGLFFSQEWETLHRNSLAEESSGSLVERYHHLVTGTGLDWQDRVKAARLWLDWDCLGSSLLSPGGSFNMTDKESVATASIGLQLYKEVPHNSMYKSEVLVERGAKALARNQVPVRLVAGRQDMLCPPAWAVRIRNRVVEEGGKAEVELMEGAAHSELDPGMGAAMVRAVDAVLHK